MSKQKDIGTKAETAVKNAIIQYGYTPMEAHRNILKGSADEGDVWLRSIIGLIVFEVKGGKAAKEASYEQIKKWCIEAETERVNASASFGFLVTQRAGVGYPRAGEWWAYVKLQDLIKLKTYSTIMDKTIVRLTLNDLLKLIHG
jgi:hypothetical protein